MKKFFASIYFDVILAVLAAVLIIMQEVWIGSTVAFFNGFAMGGIAGLGFVLVAEVIKMFVFGGGFNWKNVCIATACGLVAALVTALLVL